MGCKTFTDEGRSTESRVFNDYLDAIIVRAHNLHNELLKLHEHVSPHMLRDAILGTNSSRPRMLVRIWSDHVENLRKLIGRETTYATAQKYNTVINHFNDFLRKTYRTQDIVVISMRNSDGVVDANYKLHLFPEGNKVIYADFYNILILTRNQMKRIIREFLRGVG